MIDKKINFLDTTNLKDRCSENDVRGRDLFNNSDYNWESLLSQDNDNLVFDSKTTFPASDSQKFAEILEKGKNRGLGINELHKMGYTGKGVTVAIIDQPLLVSHEAIKDNILHYEEIRSNSNNACASQHGIAVSSILCGKIGVLPDAKLVYFSTSGNINRLIDENFQALENFIEYNKTLPEENKIHVVSVSFGFSHGNTSQEEQEKIDAKLKEITKRLNENDIFLVSPALNKTHNLYYVGSDRNIEADLDDANNYFEPIYLKNIKEQNQIQKMPTVLVVPQDRTTVASPTGNNDYAYYTDGGISWATPYLAGVYALAKSIDKTLTPDKFFEYAISTGQMKELKGQECAIINSKNLIKTLEFSKGTDKIENKSNNNRNIGTSNDR